MSHLECEVQFWSLQLDTDMDMLESVYSRAKKIIKGLKHLSYRKSLRELGLFGSRTEYSECLINVYKYSNGGWQRRWSQTLFSSAHRQKQRQWALTDIYMPLKCRSIWKIEHVVQRDCVIPIFWNTQLLIRPRAKQPAEAHHAWRNGLDDLQRSFPTFPVIQLKR